MRIVASAALAAALLGGITPASAHAHLRSASPAVDGTVQRAPTEIALEFSEAVEPRFSRVEVTDAAGTRVDQGTPHADSADAKRLLVGVRPLPAGHYAVSWHAVSVDTHRTEGRYGFTIAPVRP